MVLPSFGTQPIWSNYRGRYRGRMQTLRSKFGFHQSGYYGEYSSLFINNFAFKLVNWFRITKLICTYVNIGQIPDWTIQSWWIHWTWTTLIWSKPSGNPKCIFPMPKTQSSNTSLYPMYWYASIQADKFYTCYGTIFLTFLKNDETKLIFCSLKLKFSCMMELSNFPLDEQVCTMEIASCKCIFIVLLR